MPGQHAAASPRATPAAPTVPPPVWLLGGLVTQVLTARRWGRGRFPGQAAVATVLTGAGLAAAVGGVRAIRSHDTTIDAMHPDEASTLITDGVFARTRNPIYLSGALLLAAGAVATGRFAALLPAAAFVAHIDQRQIPAEEAALERLFPDEYDAYRARVRRWA